MNTEKLYYSKPEKAEFSARVLDCRPADGRWELVLDRTAFYPEGGGQPCDLGSIDGAGVLAVYERDGEILHAADRPFDIGASVCGRVDMVRRRDYTEQHTADHVLSGVIHRQFGYDNVGFHMGAETTTIDLNGVLTQEQLAQMEERANDAVRRDLPVIESWPAREVLELIEYRSKKEISGEVRMITIPGVDVCACCGTHVRSTGELGLIKAISMERLRGGVRIEMVAGARAWRWAARVFEENRKNSVMLSARQLDTASAVERLLAEQERLRAELAETEKRWLSAVSWVHAGEKMALLFESGLSGAQVQRLADALMDSGGTAAVFSGSDAEGWRYAIGRRDGDVRELVRELNAALSGRGGGKPFFAQGQVKASRAEIEAFFAARAQES